jgi:hypothetical protein
MSYERRSKNATPQVIRQRAQRHNPKSKPRTEALSPEPKAPSLKPRADCYSRPFFLISMFRRLIF